MRRTHVHVSDSGSVWIIHEDPYNMNQEEKVSEEKSSPLPVSSSPNIDVVLHAEGHANETINLDESIQSERYQEKNDRPRLDGKLN